MELAPGNNILQFDFMKSPKKHKISQNKISEVI